MEASTVPNLKISVRNYHGRVAKSSRVEQLDVGRLHQIDDLVLRVDA